MSTYTLDDLLNDNIEEDLTWDTFSPLVKGMPRKHKSALWTAYKEEDHEVLVSIYRSIQDGTFDVEEVEEDGIESAEEGEGEIEQEGEQETQDEEVEETPVETEEEVEEEVAPIDVVIFNPGANVFFPIEETTARVYRKVWEMATFAGFLTGREATKYMKPRGHGSILFTGATASIRGGAGFSAFAGAKFALRALSQSMARELGPQGIHVAHIIIDGAIDTPWIKENFPDTYAPVSYTHLTLPTILLV